jgi:hypothetical protein
MKPLRHPLVPAGRSHGRTPAVLLVISERNHLIRAAAKFYPGARDREIARRLHSALSTYRDGRWRRDRTEATCPPQHKGKLMQVLWMILKTRDHVPSEMTIRRALASSRDPAKLIHCSCI